MRKATGESNPKDRPPSANLAASDALPSRVPRLQNAELNQTEREQLQRLQDQNLRRTLALASAAHELKTPLAVLSGYVELLLNEQLGPLTTKQRQVLAEMDVSSRRLRLFTEDFLTYSALELGKQTMHLQPGDINACASEVCGIWLTRFQNKGLPFYFMPGQDIEPFLFDYCKVQHVLSNLLENAWKYSPKSGTVWLSTEPYLWERRSYRTLMLTIPDRRKQPKTTPNSVRVTLTDTGPAIPPEYHQELFQEFLRLPQPSGREEGTGLGLAIARRLVQAHGGKIWLQSEHDKGNSFCFILPYTPVLEGGVST